MRNERGAGEGEHGRVHEMVVAWTTADGGQKKGSDEKAVVLRRG